MAPPPRLKGLLLVGGQSLRMGSPKHLLPFIDGRPIYLHLMDQLRNTSPDLQGIAISIHDLKEKDEIETLCIQSHIDILCDAEVNDGSDAVGRIGPAAGLLAAYHHDPTAHWLVLACDYPLIRSEQLKHLLEQFEEPVTCFRNREGFCEPLLGIWSPEALRRLEENVRMGKTGPSRTMVELGGKTVSPTDDFCLLNANTRDEWERVMRMIEETRR